MRPPILRPRERSKYDRTLLMACSYSNGVTLASLAFMVVLVLLGGPAVCRAQEPTRWYAGGLIGVSTLSADARAVTSPSGFAVSLYKPENGLAANLFIGTHLSDYLTLQANYIWNRNELTLVSTRAAADGIALSEQTWESAQNAIVGDGLVYFRSRASRFRPYLSAGVGLVRFASDRTGDGLVVMTMPPEPEFSDQHATARVAVGIDVSAGRDWMVRYSFSESVSGNSVSVRLSPRGERNLANFQNLVGLVRTF